MQNSQQRRRQGRQKHRGCLIFFLPAHVACSLCFALLSRCRSFFTQCLTCASSWVQRSSPLEVYTRCEHFMFCSNFSLKSKHCHRYPTSYPQFFYRVTLFQVVAKEDDSTRLKSSVMVTFQVKMIVIEMTMEEIEMATNVYYV